MLCLTRQSGHIGAGAFKKPEIIPQRWDFENLINSCTQPVLRLAQRIGVLTMQNDTFTPVSRELADDFFFDLQEAYERCERTLLTLENDPDDQNLIAELFRSIHTIKGNLIYIGLKGLTPLLQSVENILEELRSSRLSYDDLLSDIILLALDHTKALVNENLYQQDSGICSATFADICKAIDAICQKPNHQRPQAIYDAVLTLDPNTNIPPPSGSQPGSSDYQTVTPPFNRELRKFGVIANADLDFLANLMPAIEERSPYWQGRSRRIAKLALAMNDQADRRVDPTQLTAAVYMHDISMAFLPLELLHKKSRLNNDERYQVNAHARLSYDLLQRMSNWGAAAQMVLHHHEHCDGNGYPKGLKEMEICDGAKILAIADTFDACSHGRAHHPELKRPLIRSVLEINRFAGSQFSQYWVNRFNKVAQNRASRP